MNNRPPDSSNNGQNGQPNKNAQRIWLGIGAFVLLIFLLMVANQNSPYSTGNTLSFDKLADLIKNGNVSDITVSGGREIIVETTNNGIQRGYKEAETNLREEMFALGVCMSYVHWTASV